MTVDRAPLIAHVIFRLDIGGLETGLVNLINHMPAAAYRHAIVCLNRFSPEFRNRIRRPDVTVVSIDKRKGKDPAAYWRVWRVLRELRPDVVHTRNLGTVDMQWIAAVAGVPHRVHGEHGWDASDPKGLSPRGLRIRRACGPVIDRYVPMSIDIRTWLIETVGVPSARITQLYSGVDAQRFMPRSDAENTARADGPATLGTVGRLDPVKNQADLLHAFAQLRKTRPGLRLVVVGDGPLRTALAQTANELNVADAVTFTGASTDTAPLMRGFDVFVLPSRNEGISNTILEAMASGLPVVAGRVGGNPELVRDGVTGALYDAAEPAALESALARYVDDAALRKAHGAAGRARVVADFSLEAMVARYQQMYDSLFNDRAVASAA